MNGKNLAAVPYSVRFEVIIDRDTGEVVGSESRGLTWSSAGEAYPVLEGGMYGDGVVMLGARAHAEARGQAWAVADRFRAMLEAGEEVEA